MVVAAGITPFLPGLSIYRGLTLLATDSSKAGDDHLHRFATLAEVDLVVTDTDLADDVAAELRAAGPEVVTA